MYELIEKDATGVETVVFRHQHYDVILHQYHVSLTRKNKSYRIAYKETDNDQE